MKLYSSVNFKILAVAFALVFASSTAQAEEDEPVRKLPGQSIRIVATSKPVNVPYESSQDLTKMHPEVTRAIILIHGLKRNVESAYHTLDKAAQAAHSYGPSTLLITPQFLNQLDARAHHLSSDLLRWHANAWESGENSVDAESVSSFAVLDAFVSILADRNHYPNLNTIVLAGHSGGGQLIQRYAVVGHAEKLDEGKGIDLHYISANPSSYLYFSNDRPANTSAPFKFAPYNSALCEHFDYWKYGPVHSPDYVAANAGTDWTKIEKEYAHRHVIYLLGTADNDPHHPELDTSCEGEAEGPSRFIRGQAYYSWLYARHTDDWNQHMWFVPHVAHSAEDMFTSACGLAALFDKGSCQDQ